MQFSIPERKRGRQTAEDLELYELELELFARRIRQIRSSLDFTPGLRGWCYILEEEAGLSKGEFGKAMNVITQCRKKGLLPLDITAVDAGRTFECGECFSQLSPAEYVDQIIRWAHDCVHDYYDHSFWEDQRFYLQMVVEKVDLKELFRPLCEEFHVRIANARGWSSLHQRADMMRSFRDWEEKGKEPVLLYCGDFDPAGVLISDKIRDNLEELAVAVGWNPENLVINRFGLNQDFIEQHNLSWTENLITASGSDMANPNSKQHNAYVQDWIKKVGIRKVEANALVTRPVQGRQLCRDAIIQYVSADSPKRYEARIKEGQQKAAIVLQMVLDEGIDVLDHFAQDGEWDEKEERRKS